MKTIRAWLASRRRTHAAGEIGMVWTCWFLFFNWVHKKPELSTPAAVVEYHAQEAAHYHKRMVRPLRWWHWLFG